MHVQLNFLSDYAESFLLCLRLLKIANQHRLSLCAVIHYLSLKGLSAKRGPWGHGSNSQGRCLFFIRVSEAERAWKMTPLPGRPFTVTREETTDKIHDMKLTDPQITQQYIATGLDASQDYVQASIHKDLQITWLSARWAPKLSWSDERQIQHNMSRDKILPFLSWILQDFSRDS